ncbi:alkaline phosphatase family protein [Lactiplantibacillus plantarum]|nr:alkaline phosphatase family protein [Lactiplantibacillus plantarum]
MQSDYMDGQGHGHGWYNDNYWDKYAQYDALFKRVMDKLEATGHIHDTLVIANADHGGSGKNHGGWDEYNRSIFMAPVAKRSIMAAVCMVEAMLISVRSS